MGQAATSASNHCCSKSEQPPLEEVTAHSSTATGEVDSSDANAPVDAISSKDVEIAVDLTRTERDLLRGIPLRKTLRQAGRFWRYKPSDLAVAERQRLYSFSQPVEKIDLFISHAWSTSGRWKYLSLLLHFGWRTMLAAWALGTALTFALCMLDVLPLLHSLEASVAGTAAGTNISCGTWLTSAGLISALGGLFASPYLPLAQPDMAFVDLACVHQADEELMQKGIQNIGGFLEASTQLHVLWSAPYLSRLWCVFELAAYRKVNPYGRIVLAPLFIETITLQIFLWLQLMTSLFWYWRVAREGRLVPTGWVLAFMLSVGWLCGPLVHSLRLSYRSKKALIDGLDGFDLLKVECLNDSDRERIHAAIVRWYGSLDAFSAYIRGPFRQDVLGGMQAAGSIPFGYICVLAVPVLNMSLEGVLALFKADIAQSALAYTLSIVVGLAMLWVPAMLVLLVFACERWVAPKSTRCFNYLQTLAIVLALWGLFGLGALIAISSHQRGFGFVLVWTGASLLFAGITWRCCWQGPS